MNRKLTGGRHQTGPDPGLGPHHFGLYQPPFGPDLAPRHRFGPPPCSGVRYPTGPRFGNGPPQQRFAPPLGPKHPQPRAHRPQKPRYSSVPSLIELPSHSVKTKDSKGTSIKKSPEVDTLKSLKTNVKRMLLSLPGNSLALKDFVQTYHKKNGQDQFFLSNATTSLSDSYSKVILEHKYVEGTEFFMEGG